MTDNEINKAITDNEAQLGQAFEDGMKVGKQEMWKRVVGEIEQFDFFPTYFDRNRLKKNLLSSLDKEINPKE